jgi:hypothetical protein
MANYKEFNKHKKTGASSSAQSVTMGAIDPNQRTLVQADPKMASKVDQLKSLRPK